MELNCGEIKKEEKRKERKGEIYNEEKKDGGAEEIKV